jgi:hypothetical protein
MASTPTGITEVDRLVTQAIEKGIKIPNNAPRWQILAWAAELMDLQRRDPVAADRDGWRDVSRSYWPDAI